MCVCDDHDFARVSAFSCIFLFLLFFKKKTFVIRSFLIFICLSFLLPSLRWSAMARVFVDRSEADLKNKWNSMQRSEKRKRAAKKYALVAAARVAQDAMKEDNSYPQGFGVAFPPSGGDRYTFVADGDAEPMELADIFGTNPDPDV